LQRRLDLADDLGRGAVHHRDPVRDLGLHLQRKAGQDRRGERRGDVREHQRDRLRVLVLHVREQLPGVGVAEEVERDVVHRGFEAVQDERGALLPEGRLEQLAGVVHAAGAGVPRGRHGVELVHHVVDDDRVELAQPRDLGRDHLDLFLRHAGQDLR
jgi:hypothetical protein